MESLWLLELLSVGIFKCLPRGEVFFGGYDIIAQDRVTHPKDLLNMTQFWVILVKSVIFFNVFF